MSLTKYLRQDSEKRIILFIGLCTAVIHSTLAGYVGISKLFMLLMLFWFSLNFFRAVEKKEELNGMGR